MPAWEPLLPLFFVPGFEVREVGVAERGFDSVSVSILRRLDVGFLGAAVPFFLMDDDDGAGRFFENIGAGFESIGDVTLSATLAFLFARSK